MSLAKIEKGIPIPANATTGPGTPRKYPLAEMEVGDSFLAPLNRKGSVKSRASLHARKTGRQFCVRVTEAGVRVWRIK